MRGLESCRFLYGIAGFARWIGLSLTRVFLFALPYGQKSRKSGRLFPAGVLSGCGVGLNLVDFHKVSLASRDGFVFTLRGEGTQIAQKAQILFYVFRII